MKNRDGKSGLWGFIGTIRENYQKGFPTIGVYFTEDCMDFVWFNLNNTVRIWPKQGQFLLN